PIPTAPDPDEFPPRGTEERDLAMAYPTLSRSTAAMPARDRRKPGIEITLKPDKVVFGDFPVPALLVSPEAEGPVAVPTEARLRRTPRGSASLHPSAPRRRRPPRMPEPLYALLRRMAVEIVC